MFIITHIICCSSSWFLVFVPLLLIIDPLFVTEYMPPPLSWSATPSFSKYLFRIKHRKAKCSKQNWLPDCYANETHFVLPWLIYSEYKCWDSHGAELGFFFLKRECDQSWSFVYQCFVLLFSQQVWLSCFFHIASCSPFLIDVHVACVWHSDARLPLPWTCGELPSWGLGEDAF